MSNIPKSPFASQQVAMQFALDNELMEWGAVAEAWREMSGESISNRRVWQIGMVAQKKLAAQLQDLREEVGA